VIDVLNRFYVPITTSNDDYNKNGGASQAEKGLREGIARRARETLHMPNVAGADVACYIVRPDGVVHACAHLPEMAETPFLLNWLQAAVKSLGTQPGQEPVAPPAQRAARPRTAGPNDLVMYLTTRYLADSGEKQVFPSGDGTQLEQLYNIRLRAVSLFPTEDWLVLGPDDWAKLLGPAAARVGNTWEVDRPVAERLLTNFRPSSTNNDPSRRRFDQLELNATLVSVGNGTARAKLSGKFRMWHPFVHFKDDNQYVEASVVGYVDFEPQARRVTSLRLVTDRATYMGGEFGAALHSVP
jgi:hypothetical protein